jgi:hypothetical protein
MLLHEKKKVLCVDQGEVARGDKRNCSFNRTRRRRRRLSLSLSFSQSE